MVARPVSTPEVCTAASAVPMPGPRPTCASQKSTSVRELCGYIWQSVPTLVSVPSRTPRPQRVPVAVQPDRRLDLADRALVAGVGLRRRPVQEGGQGLPEHRPALVLEVADQLDALPGAGVHHVHRRADLVRDQRSRVDLHRLEDVRAGLQPALEQPVLPGPAHPLGQEVPHPRVLGVDGRERLRARLAERLAGLVEEVPRDAVGVHAEALGLRALVAEEELERPEPELDQVRGLGQVLAGGHHRGQPVVHQRVLVAGGDGRLGHLAAGLACRTGWS